MRGVFVAAGLAVCLLGAWSEVQIGLARRLAEQSLKTGLLDPAVEAVRLNPYDPKSHHARAAALTKTKEVAEAVEALECAIALGPNHYELWLSLGKAHNQNGNSEDALAAFREATRLAPFYAKPRWELGVQLLNTGRRDEAFAEFRRATASDPAMLSEVIELGWKAYNGDVQSVEQAIQAQTARARLTLASFFVRQGHATEALTLFRSAGDASVEDRQALLAEMLNARQFASGYSMWASRREANVGALSNGIATLTDGGFESTAITDEIGFGWRLEDDLRTVRVSLDTAEPRMGRCSLRLDWRGISSPSELLAAQLALVEPGGRYRLSFAARTKEIVTGGAPVITVTDVSDKDEQMLVESAPLPQGTHGWQDYEVEFATAKTTSAVRIAIQRQKCSSEPCPIFGTVWLDDFSLLKFPEPQRHR